MVKEFWQAVKVIWQDHIAAKDGRFNHIRPVAPMCTPMWAHWRHLANTTELVLPSVHSSPQPKWLVSLGTLAPPANTVEIALPGPPEFTTQTANRSVQSFLHSSRQKVPILYNGRPFPPKLPFLTGIWTPSNSAVFAQMTAECPYTLQWATPSPRSKLPHHGNFWTPI